jgi:O-antigen/teichoic acid export membrane protein
MTISSIIALLAFADLGIGNGLLNAISEAHGKDDRELARTYVSSTFFMLLALAVALGSIFAIAYPSLPWGRIFNIKNADAIADAGPAVCVLIGCFLLNMPLGIINRIQLGYQEGFENNIWNAVGNLLGLLSVLLVIYSRGTLCWLVLAMAGAPIIAVFLNGVRLFIYKRPWLWPTWAFTTHKAAVKVLGLGFLFFVLQFAAAVAFSSDNMITTQILGSAAVTQYSVHARLFSIAPMLLMMVLSPLWPAYSEAIARGDVAWVRRTLIRSIITSLVLSTICSVFFVVAGPFLLRIWVGDRVVPVLPLLLGLGIWTILSTVGNALAMFLNGASVMRFQVIASLAMAALAVSLKIFLTQKIGVAGVVWGTVIAYTVAVAIPCAVVVPSILAKLIKRNGRLVICQFQN